MAATPDADVAVVGGGPAGWASAAALAAGGLRVVVLGDDDRAWPQTFGVWRDEVAGLLGDADLAAVWPRVLVSAGGALRPLARTYARVDNAALRRRLTTRAIGHGATRHPSAVVACAHTRTGSTLGCADGSSLSARLVVDASGHHPALVARTDPGLDTAQVAVGWRGRLRRAPYPPGAMVLMDFADDHLDASERAHDPTFCYAMDHGDGTWLVEETSLARRPPMDPTRLHDRLLRRLAHHGAEPDGDGTLEEVTIPLGGPTPPPQRVVAIGGAAGMVHPATGYLLAFTLATAPRLARAVTASLRGRDADPDAAAAAGWQAVWPHAARVRQALYRFGLEALLRLDAAQTRAFVDRFFDLPDPVWRGYLSATLSPAQLAAAMGRLFVLVDGPVRRQLVRAGLGAPGHALAHQILLDSWRPR